MNIYCYYYQDLYHSLCHKHWLQAKLW